MGKRGGTAALARAASSCPGTRKPRVEIPEGKLDEYVGRIYAEAKERAKNRPASGSSLEFLHTSLDDTQLSAYFGKVLNEAKARSCITWDHVNARGVQRAPSCVGMSSKGGQQRSYGDWFQ